MTLSLATRGYLCRGRVGVSLLGPGPVIVGAESMEPIIIGGAAEPTEPPDIVGGGSLTPSITGDVPTAPSPTPEGPQIVSGESMSPQITGADEED
jgi:hypothetical protein